MALTQAQIASLLATPSTGIRPPKSVLVRVSDNALEWRNPKGLDKGSFVGKAGTKRRSRKGNVTTLPNGRRDYVECGNWWDTDGLQVVAY